jgi:holo-[acyl-carrier protein] synthase
MDLVWADEVREALDAHGDRYLQRVFTERELAQCGRSPRRLAGRFAAKEATMKVLRTDDEPLPWRSIGVHARPGGELTVELSGPAANLAARQGIGGLAVSVTHRRALAAAVVLAEGLSV